MGGSAIGIVDAAWWQGTLSYNGFIRSAWLVASVMLVVWGVAQVLFPWQANGSLVVRDGHVVGAGFDAAEVFRGYGDRVYDMHFKDKTIQKDAKGKDTPVDTEIGKGDTKYPALFAEMKKSKWSGVMAIETDSKAFAEDPNMLVAGAKKFFAAQVGKK